MRHVKLLLAFVVLLTLAAGVTWAVAHKVKMQFYVTDQRP
jgi:hypothetical protein